ncbi:hypothetical protein HNV10_17025 [Winogradskyella litoriviva]|uniref:Lipoprotein n=1 Tax=Winogradskyella litoriviva TaxID=1220182 RepID=A0ABX2EC10_9FLAO|nr:hypothetical protein [Winogradskyella litoriviva]NRD24956.1 hypothetical protein [Winogradskyella litoriviva]
MKEKLIIKNLKVIMMLVIFSSFYYCKKQIPTVTNSNSLNHEKSKNYLEIYYPDTVNIKNTYEGIILYKSHLDTITTELFKKGDTIRLVTLYIQDNKTLFPNDFEHILKSKECDTFYPLNDGGEIKFEHKFNSLGINYLEGVLEDEVIYKETDTSSGLRILTKFSHINLPVFVTDDKNLIDSFFKEEIKNTKPDKNDIKEIKI